MKLRLIHYFDVWGNVHDGYMVNNLCEEAVINFRGDDWPDNRAILKALKRIGFVKKTTRLRSVRFEGGSADIVEITERNGKPICRLEKVEDNARAYHKEYRGIIISTVCDEDGADE